MDELFDQYSKYLALLNLLILPLAKWLVKQINQNFVQQIMEINLAIRNDFEARLREASEERRNEVTKLYKHVDEDIRQLLLQSISALEKRIMHLEFLTEAHDKSYEDIKKSLDKLCEKFDKFIQRQLNMNSNQSTP